MSEPTLPDLPAYCWPVDWSCAPTEWLEDEANAAIIARSEALAASTLRALSGYQVGGCPVTVRPCSKACLDAGAYLIFPVTGAPGFGPSINANGRWVNGCGCRTDCSCGPLQEVILPGPVGAVTKVVQDGTEVDPSKYRVDNGNRLVRLDGDLWPTCQDMEADDEGQDAFSVTYLHGLPVNGVASFAAGLLAYEFAKACGGANCALPKNVTGITRLGVSMEIEPGNFPNGLTGILAVDAWLRSVNPYQAVVPSAVYSVDSPVTRRTTWSA